LLDTTEELPLIETTLVISPGGAASSDGLHLSKLAFYNEAVSNSIPVEINRDQQVVSPV
jgi:hypothetical protein